MLAALVVAASCAAWHGQATGHYLGEVQSAGPKAIDTWITEGPSGALSGTYVLHEPDRDVRGTLDPLGDDGCDAALFRWTDVYGAGVARLRFFPQAHCFEGEWGLGQPQPQLTWRSCARTPVTS